MVNKAYCYDEDDDDLDFRDFLDDNETFGYINDDED